MKWFWLIIGTVTSEFSGCPSEPRRPAAEAEVLTPSLYVFTADNFLEGNKHDVTVDGGYSRECTAFTIFQTYLFLPLQTMMKAQMMMQMRAMHTPTVIPVIDFWSRW